MALGDDVDRLVREIREEAPDKAAEVDRYVATDRFLKLTDARKIEALTILKSALKDARAKARGDTRP